VPWYSGWRAALCLGRAVSFLSRVFGVQPDRAHAVRVERDLVIPAGEGVPLLANRFYPADIHQPPVVLLRSPYGRGVALDRMPQLVVERGYQVLNVSLRGTGGRHGPDDPYWQATDHRKNVVRMPPVVYLQGGWYDFFLPGMLADYAALRIAGRTVRLLIGPLGAAAVCTPVSGCVTHWQPWTRYSPTAHRPRGCGCLSRVPAAGPTCPAGHRPPVPRHGIYSRRAGLPTTQPPPDPRAGSAMTRRTRPRPSQAPPSVWLPVLSITVASKHDRMFSPSRAIPKPPIWR
jgi:hypothetical protein